VNSAHSSHGFVTQAERNKITADGAQKALIAQSGLSCCPDSIGPGKVFEEFRQVEGDYAHKTEGTGLGLTLAKKFVEQHGGKI
jgi:signal transduction histidine kinase